MPQYRHLLPSDTVATEPYTYAKKVGKVEFKVPPRDDRPTHGGRLIQEVEAAAEVAELAYQAELAAEKKAEEEAAKAALEAKKQEVLAKLGLTSDEVAALLA